MLIVVLEVMQSSQLGTLMKTDIDGLEVGDADSDGDVIKEGEGEDIAEDNAGDFEGEIEIDATADIEDSVITDATIVEGITEIGMTDSVSEGRITVGLSTEVVSEGLAIEGDKVGSDFDG